MNVYCPCGDKKDKRQQRSIRTQEKQIGKNRRFANYHPKNKTYTCTVCGKVHLTARQ